MRLMLSILLMFVLMPWHALGATPKPSTEPKEGEDTILDGAIIFTAPEGWQQLSHDQQTVQYTSPDRKGTIVVTARPQEVNINKSVADQIGMAIKKKIAEQVKADRLIGERE